MLVTLELVSFTQITRGLLALALRRAVPVRPGDQHIVTRPNLFAVEFCDLSTAAGGDEEGALGCWAKGVPGGLSSGYGADRAENSAGYITASRPDFASARSHREFHRKTVPIAVDWRDYGKSGRHRKAL